MKPLADQMASYGAYHNDETNKAIHSLFVPLIVWSTMGLLALPGAVDVGGLRVTLAHVATVAALAYYLRVDYAYGVALAVLFTVLLTTSLQVMQSAGSLALPFFGAVFVLSWAAQIVGHIFFEGRRPAFVDNVLQVFTAPMFVMAEWGFTLGLRKALQDEVHRKTAALLRTPDEELPGRPLYPQ
jgi:uncharacterized membrane protein YGL010W